MRYLQLLVFLFPLLTFAQSVPTDGTTETYQNITEIQASYIYQLVVERGNTSTVRIEATDKIRDLLRASVKGKRLTLSVDPSMNFSPKEYRDVEVKVYVTLPVLREISLSGATRADVRNLEQDGEISIDMSGAAKLDISGSADSAELRLSGASSMDGKNFRVGQCRAALSGAANAKLETTESIRGKVSGAGSLRYTGQPQKQDVKVSGAGSVRGN